MCRRPFVPLLCHTLGTTLTVRNGEKYSLSTTYDRERLIMREKPKNSLPLLAQAVELSGGG
jgi:hypothetical protein